MQYDRGESMNSSDIVHFELLPDGRMTATMAAKYLGISPKTLANQRSAGTGPPYVKRGRIFYYRADLDAWLRAGRVEVVQK